MIGPLPAGAWMAVVAGGFAFMLYTRHAASSSTAASSTPVDVSGGTGAGGSGMWTDVTPPDGSAAGPGAITTDDQWKISAVDYLIGKGYDPGLADSAIRKYMDGAKLSVSEYALVREALLHLGEPPQPLGAPLYDNPSIPGTGHVPPPPTHVPAPHQPPPLPKPSPNPVPKPTNRRTYTTKHGDTLWTIALHYYGNPLKWRDILAANPGKVPNNDPRRLQPNTVLVIP